MVASWTEKDDAELLELIRDGSHHAFSTLVQRHAEKFYYLAYRYAQDRQVAEDLVQDAFLKLWERPEMWQPERNAKFTTWFYQVVSNLGRDWLKKKKPLPLDETLPIADTRDGQEVELQQRQQQVRLERAIAALPETQRRAINLCFLEGISNQEAADIMEISLKALQSLLMRGKASLKKTMSHYG